MAQRKKVNKKLDDEDSHTDSFEKMPSIFKLNDDCMLHIFSFLLIKERLRMQSVCKKWQALINLPWNDIKKLKINFSLATDDQDIKFNLPILKHVLRHCGSSITRLELISFRRTGFNNTVIVLLTKKCPNVRSLDTTHMSITRKMMESIASFRNLTHFTIGTCWSGCEEQVSNIFLANKHLRSVEFHECYRLNKNSLSSLPTTIESIGFGRNCGFETDVVCKLLSKLKKLQTLIIDNERLANSLDKLLQMLPAKSNLKELRFPGITVISEVGSPHNLIQNLHLFTNLQKLTLTGGSILHDEQLEIIGQHCRSLTYASLSYSLSVTDRGLCSFVKLLNLEEFRIAMLRNITSASIASMSMPSLKVFYCSNCCPLLSEADFHVLWLGVENLEVLEVVSDFVNVSLDLLISQAMVYTENRNTDKVLKIIYRSNSPKPRICKVSTRLIVEIQNFRVWPHPVSSPRRSSSSDSSSSSSSQSLSSSSEVADDLDSLPSSSSYYSSDTSLSYYSRADQSSPECSSPNNCSNNSLSPPSSPSNLLSDSDSS